MHVKKFTAKNIKEALILVKKELGPDAIIISTRDLESSSNNGKHPVVEVTAAMDFNCDDLPGVNEFIHPLQKEITDLKEIVKSMSPDLLASTKKNSDDSSKREMVELKSIVHYLINNTRLLKDVGIHDSLIKIYKDAIDRGVNERLAFLLIERVNGQITDKPFLNEDNLKTRFFREMTKSIKTNGIFKKGPEKQKIVSFVGPTGVGKTTTVAKLAAELALNQKKEVALLTLDTYRIGAVEQLKIYSKIIDIPMFVARDKQEFNKALELCKDKDVVLIDTAGRSRKDEKQMKELMGFLNGDIQVETHLVLSATDQEEILFSNIKRFYPLSVNSLIFTKLDEADSFGVLFNIAMKTNKPISYFTTGQKVPEDIEAATAEKTIDLIFE